jgi:hypothetical protein
LLQRERIADLAAALLARCPRLDPWWLLPYNARYVGSLPHDPINAVTCWCNPGQ